MTQYSIDPRTRKYVEEYCILLFVRKCEKQLMDKGLYVSKKVAHKGGKFLGNKITDEQITIPPEKETKN